MRCAIGVVGVLAVVAACSSFTGSDPPANPVDGGGVDADAEAAEGGVPVTLCQVLFVATDGYDGDDGCSKDTAVKTIGAALARAKATAVAGREIHVCAGTYPEDLVLDVPVSLRGGYSCNKFERTPSFGLTGFNPDGTATGFDGASLTTIATRDDAPFTLRVAGAAVDASVTIDGFAVSGPLSTSSNDVASNAAILVTDHAAPIIENCDVKGGSYNGNVQLASAAVGVTNHAAPIIRKSRLVAGSGRGPIDGSVAVLVNGAGAVISGNHVDGGTGDGNARGAMGVHVYAPDRDMLLENNHVWTAGSSTGTSGTAGIGIYVEGDAGITATLRGNRLHPRSGSHCNGTGCILFGIVVDAIKSELDGNIVELGTYDTTSTPSFARQAVALRGVASAHVVDNVIHGGEPHPAGMNNTDEGLVVSGGTIIVQHNTIFGGAPGTSTTTAVEVNQTNALSIIDNLFLVPTLSGTTSTGVTIDCSVGSGVTVTAFQNNAFVGDQTMMTLADCKGTGVKSTLDTTTLLNTETFFAARGNNVAVRTSCANDSSTCLAVPSCADNCPGSVITNWSISPRFGGDILFAPGWILSPSVPCLLATGGQTADPATDAAGKARTSPTSIGAYELDRTCP